MSYEDELRNSIIKQSESKIAVENIVKSLQQSVSDKTHEAAEIRGKIGTSDNPEEAQTMRGEADKLEQEAEDFKAKANEMQDNPEKYQKEYEAYQEKTAEEKTQSASKDEGKEQDKEKEPTEDKENDRNSPNAEPQHETAGDQIKDVFQGEGLLDRAFAEMLGNVADTVSGQNRTQQQEQTQEPNKTAKR